MMLADGSLINNLAAYASSRGPNDLDSGAGKCKSKSAWRVCEGGHRLFSWLADLERCLGIASVQCLGIRS
jgi:hypothetical protein